MKIEMNKKNIIIAIAIVLVLIILGFIIAYSAQEAAKRKEQRIMEGATEYPKTKKEAEKRLETTIPTLEGTEESEYNYELYGKDWPWHAVVRYSDYASLEMAKTPQDLVFTSNNTVLSTTEEKEYRGIYVTYYSENEYNTNRIATWRYHTISYAFKLGIESETDIETYVHSIIDQLLPEETPTEE